MSQLHDDEEKPLDPEAARIVAKVRWLMIISGATTLIGVSAILGVIGYRVFRTEGSAPPPKPADINSLLPAGARVVSTAVAEGRIVVTIETAGVTEVRSFDLKTLAPLGRIRLEPGR
jgi:hypothetical protein